MEHLQHIFEASLNGLLLFEMTKMSTTWICINANKAAGNLLGVNAFTGKSINELLPETVALNLTSVAQDTAFDFFLSDQKRWILASSNQKESRLTLSLTDITHFKEAAFEDRRMKRFYQLMSSNLADNEIIVFDKELNILLSEGNPRFIRFGLDGDLMGKNLQTLFEANHFVFLSEHVAKVFGGQRADIEREVNGKFYKASLYSDNQDGSSDNLVGILLLKDVTELNKKQRELEVRMQQLDRSNRELQQFAYIASHDLQEPLRKIMSFGERLTRKYGDVLTGEGEEYISRMNNAAKRMETLINDLLSFSRATRNDRPFEETDLSVVLEEVISDMDTIDQTKAQIILPDTMPSIEAIPSQMRQLFQNLLNNSLKFTHPDRAPYVEIRYHLTLGAELPETYALMPDRNYCVIEIEDNGIGFEQVNSERIFNIFQRLHGRSEYSGTGVGLAICKKIVDNHQGVIVAKGQEGKGATFTIVLPLQQ